MLRSLFSGISGLRAHQTMLDVTGNNIANVNTTGFKSSQTAFQDTLSQMVKSGAAAQDGIGGSNPAQVGLGVKLAGISTSFTQGSSQLTGKSTDMMIQGDGFFVVSKGGTDFFTRAGNFDFDSTGQMVLPGEGAKVQGWMAVNGVVDTNAPLSDLKVPVGTLMQAKATQNAALAGNLPADATVGTLIERTTKAYDTEGNERTLTLGFTRTAAGWDLVASDGTATSPTTSLAFTDGELTTTAPITLGSTTPVTVAVTGLTSFAGVTSVAVASQDGYDAGELQAFSLGADGTITGTFSNSLKQVIGRMAMSSFTNPGGLEKAGGSLFATTANSGAAQIGTAGTGGRGTLTGGALEMSNVDLSSEFTSLIVAQRGFQANSRVITTSDDVLQELINLKR
ncbi:flagellar hook protein FlgE [Cellulomonas marina]|uniref:Flagellar hook protein FlgE n=1 Tax=Cellulomonas marina TaxID=988821 RepID=A0A1I0WH83_9CELL|nr:flagellar hook protein FlgE [Cellulomonas marina]GIG27656.1 flagellar hook protein FlgE [Cellulomonas marina]SFA88109.1 flagellar hook protein FlgE [Cellulomonas marina]